MSQPMSQAKGSIVATVQLENGTILTPIVIPIEFVGQLHIMIQSAILQAKADDLLEAKANHAEK